MSKSGGKRIIRLFFSFVRIWPKILTCWLEIPFDLNSVSDLVSKTSYRILFDQSKQLIEKVPPTDSPTVRPGRDT